MKDESKKILDETIVRYAALSSVKDDIKNAFDALYTAFSNGKRLYLCGNGGSAADCEHIAGELLKCFKKKRELSVDYKRKLCDFGEMGKELSERLEGGLPVVSLCGHPAFSTAYANDNTPKFVFAQQVSVYAEEGDVLIAISTSGNSENCLYAAIAAKAKGAKVVFLGGGNGGKIKALADVSIIVPERETFKVQELHLPVYHCLCAMLESELF
ncbi:MAG: SIS domain-containing protein [Clostridia bacterium]|nr:SIS domain-containing protein [Clostridia bacterium]